MSNPNWHNATKREPCPICHHDSWCNLKNDGSVVICMRVESDHPVKCGGWLHRLREQGARSKEQVWRGDDSILRPPSTSELPPDPRFAALHARYTQSPAQVAWFAERIGVAEEALVALDVRFNRKFRLISFPMRNAQGVITGLRYRKMDGGKFSAKGCKDGLFMPLELCHPEVETKIEELYVVEGASDAAAGYSLGLPIVGRSACLTGTEHIRGLIRRFHLQRLTIIGDNDQPGIRGAEKLRADLGIRCRIVYPPNQFKDLRDWYRSGQLPNIELFNKVARYAPYKIV